MPRLIADMDAADYLAWKVREEMISGGHIEPPTEKELSAKFRKIILERPIRSAYPAAGMAASQPAGVEAAKELALGFRKALSRLEAHEDASNNADLYAVLEANSPFSKHTRALPEGWVIVPRDLPAMIPDNVPEEFHLHSEDAVNGYTDGYNACLKAMLSAAPAKGLDA